MALTRKKLIESVNKIQTFCKNQKTCSECLFCVDVRYCSVHNPKTWNVPRSEISVRLSEDEIDELVSLSAYHKSLNDEVTLLSAPSLAHYDVAYISKVFDDFISPPPLYMPNADVIIKGGTGYDLYNKLPDEIEHLCPDYSLYGITDTAYGFLSRGCPRGCSFCIVAKKEGRYAHKVADLSEWWQGQPNIVLMDPNLLACSEKFDLMRQLAESKAKVDINQGFDCRLLTEDTIEAMNEINLGMIHFAWDFYDSREVVLKGLELYAKKGKVKLRNRTVYVLVNYDTTFDQDLERIYILDSLGFTPYVMIYDKAHCDSIYRRLSRWCNNRFIFRACKKFEDYDPRRYR